MLNENDIHAILEQLWRLQVLFERPVVQRQFIGFIVAALIAWFLTDRLWRLYGRRFSARVNDRLPERWQWSWRRGILVIRFLAFPIVGLIAVEVAANIFQTQGWRSDLILDLGGIFDFIFLYRLLLAVLYIVLGEEYMAVYHYRLLLPLFSLFVVHRILSNAIDMGRISDVILLESFGNPIKVGAVALAFIALYFLFYFSRAIQDLLTGVIVPQTHTDPHVVNAALTIGRYLVIAGAVIIVAAALGADMRTLALISGGLSVGIGFGLQEIVANFISGIILLFEQSLRPGDVVSVGGEMGEVKKLSIRAATVNTFDNIELIVPNQLFLTSTVTSYTKTDRSIRVLIPVGVSYDSNPKEVREVLLEAAQRHQLVQTEPEPAVHFMGFGDSSLDFRLAVWVDDPLLRIGVASDLHFMIWKAFAEHNIEIPFPQRDLHLRSGLPAEMLTGQTRSDSKSLTN